MTQESGNAIRRGPIRICLTTGDAMALPADLAFVGSGQNLLSRVESESESSFEKLEYPDWMERKYRMRFDGMRSTRFLASPNFIWKNVASIRARPSRELRARFQVEILESMVVTVRHIVRPRRVLFVPYHVHPKEVVVLNTLCLIYLMMRAPLGKRTFFRPFEIEIADLDDAGVFREIFASVSDNGLFREFVKRQVEKYWCMSEEQIDSNAPEFEFYGPG